jgi:hypothetical protein
VTQHTLDVLVALTAPPDKDEFSAAMPSTTTR